MTLASSDDDTTLVQVNQGLPAAMSAVTVGPITNTPQTLIRLARAALWAHLLAAHASLPVRVIQPSAETDTESEVQEFEGVEDDQGNEADEDEFLDNSAAVIDTLNDSVIQPHQGESTEPEIEGR